MFIVCKSHDPVRNCAIQSKVLVFRTPHKEFIPTHCFHETWHSLGHNVDKVGRQDERENPSPTKLDQGVIIMCRVEAD